jgi:hypothetical protein
MRRLSENGSGLQGYAFQVSQISLFDPAIAHTKDRYFQPAGTACVPEESKVIYQSKDEKQERTFGALQWLAAMCVTIPNKGEQMVPYCGYYSNVPHGRRKKQNRDALIPSVLEPDEDSKAYRKNWARLILKIHEENPLS